MSASKGEVEVHRKRRGTERTRHRFKGRTFLEVVT